MTEAEEILESLNEIKKDFLIKHDSEKLDLTLAPPCLIEHYTYVATFGANKYGRENWKKARVEDVKRYYAAMMRHQNAELSGVQYDHETGLPHGWHALWNRTAVNFFVDKFGYTNVFKHINGDIDD